MVFLSIFTKSQASSPFEAHLSMCQNDVRPSVQKRWRTMDFPRVSPGDLVRLFLRCLLKVGLPLQSNTGNHSHPEMTWAAWNIPQAALLKLMILYTWEGCLRESLEVPKGIQATSSVWCGSQCSFGVNARENGLISIWFWVHRAILEFNQANRGSLLVLLGKRHCSGHSAGESGLISQRWESLMGFLELWLEPGLYSPVTAGMSIRNWSLFSEVRTPV